MLRPINRRSCVVFLIVVDVILRRGNGGVIGVATGEVVNCDFSTVRLSIIIH